MRICVITGGTGGIGLHLCEGFQRAGYAVTALDVEQHKALPDGIGFIQTDLRQAEAVNEAFRRVTERHGAVHVLVNNAALAHFHKPVMEMTADEFDNALSVNLRGAFLCAQAFIKANAGQDYGRIINIASTRWNQNEAGWEAYGVSKGGLVSLTNTLAVSLSATPITVNAVSPGWIQVDGYETLSHSDSCPASFRACGYPPRHRQRLPVPCPRGKRFRQRAQPRRRRGNDQTDDLRRIAVSKHGVSLNSTEFKT